jgi:hypothetical protein
MKPKKNLVSKTELEGELNKLEAMWDNMLARGDDDYYEMSRHLRDKDTKEEEPTRSRRRGKRM